MAQPSPTAFAGALLDRASERRTDAAWLAERRAEAASRSLALTAEGVVLDGDRLARVPLDRVDAPIFLGLEDGAALFAGEADPTQPVAGLRDAAARLSAHETGLVAYAAGLLNWHRAHPCCSRCGARTDVAEAGFLRVCPRCGAHHHPRTDPVVIMLVTDGERVVLGRQPRWPPGRYSALAGFVEPGESLEAAVAREVCEEAGIEIRAPRYVASQPWPFPSSLMLGFMARHAGGEPSARDGELEDVRWFARDEVQAAADGRGDIHVPPPLAIARRLIDGWLAGDDA